MKKIVITVLLVAAMSISIQAQGLGMPAKLMASITGKILNYVDNFPAKSVSVVYPAGQEKVMAAVVDAFNKAGLTAKGVSGADAAAANGDVIILIPGLNDSELASIPVKKHMVISAEKSTTDKGFASFSIVNNNGKPQIMVNMQHIEKSGLQVSGKLYRVAKKSA